MTTEKFIDKNHTIRIEITEEGWGALSQNSKPTGYTWYHFYTFSNAQEAVEYGIKLAKERGLELNDEFLTGGEDKQ